MSPDDRKQAWPAPGDGELRPFRPADAKAARGRRTSPTPAPASDDAAFLSDLSVDLLEHISVLSELVTTTADGSRQQMRVLGAKVDALSAAVEALTVEMRRMQASIQASTPREPT